MLQFGNDKNSLERILDRIPNHIKELFVAATDEYFNYRRSNLTNAEILNGLVAPVENIQCHDLSDRWRKWHSRGAQVWRFTLSTDEVLNSERQEGLVILFTNGGGGRQVLDWKILEERRQCE